MAPASADNGFIGYSVGSQSSYAGSYSGINVQRLEMAVGNQLHTGCSRPYTGDAVFQTEWVNITNDAKNWLEFGTGHQCSDTVRYQYWGFGYAGDWYSLGYAMGVTNGESHGYSIVKVGNNPYYYQYDGQTIAEQNSSYGQNVQTGLESHDSTANVAAYQHHGLQFSINGAFAWNNWTTPHGVIVYYPPMCGRFVSNTAFSLAQAHSC
jgi:hypothetical protein